MGKSKFIIAVLPALAAGLAVAGCSATHLQPVAQTHSAAVRTPTAGASTSASAQAISSTPAAAIPVGIWNSVSTADPADVYGQYSITESGSLYTLTTQTAMKLADGLPNGCSLPPGTEEATFPASSTDGNGPAIYEGTEKTWYTNTCGYSSMYTATLGVLSPNKMVMTGAITLIRAGSTPSQPSAVPSSPAASSPATSSAASSPTPVAEQSCSSPTSNQETGTEQAESILTGDGYRPVNSLVDTSEEVTINGGALGLNSTGAEAVLMMMGADGQTPTEFISGLNMAADHSVKTAASACGSYGAVIVTGSEANVITLMHEDAYGTNPLYG